MSLQGISDSAATSVDGRLLATTGEASPTPTYAEIKADANALSVAHVAAADQALKFINSAISKLNDTNVDNTDVLKFTMMDRCANYDELRERCSMAACTKIDGLPEGPQEDVAHDSEGDWYTMAQASAPYPGMYCSDGAW